MARRIVPARGAGLNRKAPFWQGDTAEKVLKARLASRTVEIEAKRAARAAKRRSGRATSERRRPLASSAGARAGAPAPANKRLRRLYRALKRRKTLAAQQRVRARIKALEKELRS